MLEGVRCASRSPWCCRCRMAVCRSERARAVEKAVKGGGILRDDGEGLVGRREELGRE